jgi:5,10-methylenetetrahydromethanopterin reductase
MIEFWRAGGGGDSTFPEAAGTTEAEGWDGQMFMDSECIGADPYVLMGAWAKLTQRMKLSTGVTNPLTRHPVVTASAAASVHAISGGRAVLGIGRGDSALAYLGQAPARLGLFEKCLTDLQTLLSGGEIDFGGYGTASDTRSVEEISLGDRPAASRLQWMPPEMPKVPLDVAATGPKVIQMSARIAERVTFSVGAIPERIDWALGVARQVQTRNVSYGAQIVVVCDTDEERALAWAMGAAAPLARFQVMEGQTAGPESGSDQENFAAIGTSYDMTKHGKIHETNKLVGKSLSPDFVKRFAIVGRPDHCIERLVELVKCGLERFVVVGPGFYPEPTGSRGGLFASEVMPAVRAAAEKA